MGPVANSLSEILITTLPLSHVDVELLTIPWFDGEGLDAFAGLDEATGGEAARAFATKEFTAQPFDIFVAPTAGRWHARRIALFGAGERGSFTPNLARQLATAAALAARQRHVASFGFLVRPGLADASGEVDLSGFAQAVTEGLTLAEFSAARYKTVDPPLAPPPRSTVVLPEQYASPSALPRIESMIARGRLLGECSNLARDMANEPGNELTPANSAPTGPPPWLRRRAWRSRSSTSGRLKRSAWGFCSVSHAAAASRRDSSCSDTSRRVHRPLPC